MNEIIQHDVTRPWLLLDESVQCIITSPPYWGLRDYGTDGQLGLEKTPEEYLEKMVAVFREARRVLRNDGTLWLNMGDSYNGSGGAGGDYNKGGLKEGQPKYGPKHSPGLKPKDLCGIPWRLALALQADGWWLRSDIIWAKPNPMPESVTDRPTKAHEYIFLLTKNSKYFYDADAVREPWKEIDQRAFNKELRYSGKHKEGYDQANSRNDHLNANATGQPIGDPNRGRNARTVWNIATQPYKEAHFATFPEELVRRCMLAGTSERGCCPDCGVAWVRVVKMSEQYKKRRLTGDKPQMIDLGLFILNARVKKNLSTIQVAESGNFYGNINHGGSVSNWEKGESVPNPAQWILLKEILELDDSFDDQLANWWNETGINMWGASPENLVAPSAAPAFKKQIKTLGWRPQCECGKEPVPCVVQDPFCGSGTVPYVALKGNRWFTGFELKQEYIDMAYRRIGPLLEQGKLL